VNIFSVLYDIFSWPLEVYVEKIPHIFTLRIQASYIWFTCRNTYMHVFIQSVLSFYSIFEVSL